MTARLRTVAGILTATALAGCGGGTGSPASGSASTGVAGNPAQAVTHLSQPSAAKALAIRTLLSWLVDPTRGSSPAYLSPVNFVALPEGVLTKVQAAIPKISS